jgi:hypothetical protein
MSEHSEVDPISACVVLAELRQSDRTVYIREILADMNRDAPELYELVFRLALLAPNDALRLITREAIKYRLSLVQWLRDPARVH